MPPKLEFEISVPIGLVRIVLRRPVPGIPDDDLAGSVLRGRDDAFECRVGKRMVFDFNCHALDLWIEARPFRNRPALHHAVQFQPEVILQAAGPMLLYDESQPVADGSAPFGGLRRQREVTL